MEPTSLPCIFHILFHDREPVLVDDGLEVVSPVSTSTSTWLSKNQRSTYSLWEFVHTLNAVTENEDIAKLQKKVFFFVDRQIQ